MIESATFLPHSFSTQSFIELIFLQDFTSKLAQMWHEATYITSVYIWAGVPAPYMCEALCEHVRACISPCMHACSAGMTIHACLAGRHLWQTKKALYPCCGWHCLSAEPQLHSNQSALVFKHRAQETRWMAEWQHTLHPPRPLLPYLESQNVAVFVASQSSIRVTFNL